jgi:hypothetical protein
MISLLLLTLLGPADASDGMPVVQQRWNRGKAASS